MTSTPKKSSEAEDVLEFLASLPESDKTKLQDLKDKKNAGNGDDSDILDFLDELEANDKKSKGGKNDAKKDAVKEEKKEDKEKKDVKVDDEKANTNESNNNKADTDEFKDEPINDTNDNNESNEIPEVNDPITSISNWWSSSGSATVNSFWSNATQQANSLAQKATEEATKFAKDNNLDESFKKLQSLQLDEETKNKMLNSANEEINLPDPSRAFGFLTKNISNVLNSIVQTDEILKIQLIHDLENFNSLDSLISKNFKKVIKQVQGGIKIELNKGSTLRNHNKRNLNLFNGKLIDGEKLAFANLEQSINSYKEANKDESEEEKVRSSKLFISILPIHIVSSSSSSSKKTDEDSDDIIPIDNQSNGSFSFTMILKDITHNITIVSRSQAFPIKWAHWLDGSINVDDEEEKEKKDKENQQDEDEDEDVDPSEWVKEWIDDGLSLTFGILAQTYVVKRMGYD